MNNKIGYNFDIKFATMNEAFRAKKDLYDVAATLGNATLADLKRILNLDWAYSDVKVKWTIAEIDRAPIRPASGGKYSILLPIDEADDTDVVEDMDVSEDENCNPLYVNITTSEMDDPADILEVVFDQIIKLHDRDIFVNIY